ncbi:MAG: MerR family transcriptional regulator [Candidatus Sericytochromatia bacterium]|nr:MerR family transcriptional regulator [Candidatus Sericytochromatia bacterium]
MLIGELSQASGISAKTIRYYESIGIFPCGTRTAGGYRIYSASDIEVLILIKRARDLGFKIREINELVTFWQDPTQANEKTKEMVARHLQRLSTHVQEIQALIHSLQKMMDAVSTPNSSQISL